MKKEDKVHAINKMFVKDNALNWKQMAQEHIDESDKLKKEMELLNKKINDLNSKNSGCIFEVSADKCKNWKYADRNDFELGDIESLAEDIKINGQLQPVILRKLDSSFECEYEYEVIAGERRWRACKLAGIKLKAVLTDADDTKCLVLQTSENKKETLSAYSLSKTYMKMMKDKEISQNKMADILSIPRSTFGNLMAFNRVPTELWNEVADMSKVSSKTAGFIAAEYEKDRNLLRTFINLSGEIRQGKSIDFLNEKIRKSKINKLQNRNKTYVCKSEEGKVIFRITSSGRVTLSSDVINKYSIEEIQERLAAALEL